MSAMLLLLLIHGLHFENHCMRLFRVVSTFHYCDKSPEITLKRRKVTRKYINARAHEEGGCQLHGNWEVRERGRYEHEYIPSRKVTGK
jgi:hypothetical protein